MNRVRFQQYLHPEVLARLKAEAKKQRRSAAALAEMILEDHLPYLQNSSGAAGMQPEGKADPKGQH